MDLVKDYLYKTWNRLYILGRWMLLASISGILIGLIAGLFGDSISFVSSFRNSHPWMLYLLPVFGIIIVFIYRFDKYHTNTNLVLEGIQKGKTVPLRMAPLIIISTILTHAGGGSAGREGAALQLGGSIGSTIGKIAKLEEVDVKIMIMVGMSAAFSALFGTPLTATVFSMEVISVGIMQYAALVPCAFAAFAARDIAQLVGCYGEHFEIMGSVDFTVLAATQIIFLAVCCAFVSIFFCFVLHKTEHIFHNYIKNPYLRIVVGSLCVIGLTLLLHTTDYLSTGMSVIERAIEGEASPYAFLLKMIFTTITLGCGFKGGEIVPTLFIGSTFGCLFGYCVGLSPSLCAACGMVATFCGMTNCPLSSLFLAFELFGFEYMPFFLFCIAIAYMESGYFGLYSSQKIMYSKTRLQFIDRHTND